MFSAGFQRDKGLVLQRVATEHFAEPTAWQTWGYQNGAWAWGNPSSVALTGKFGELCLRRIQGHWLLWTPPKDWSLNPTAATSYPAPHSQTYT